MLDEPRLLLARAELPLPPEAPPNAPLLRVLAAGELETLRLPTRSPPEALPRLALELLTPAPLAPLRLALVLLTPAPPARAAPPLFIVPAWAPLRLPC